MCGLFAFIKKGPKEFDGKLKSKILAQLHHRGPDHHHDWEDHLIFLLQTRLKIIDPSDNANQPFLSQDGRYVIIYNGECYNYKSIRKRLQSLGCIFRTNSDTEVVLNAYIQWGKDFVHHLAGMFSLVIYDKKEQRIFVCRDRLGIKPLYFTETSEGVIFSSEISPLLNFIHRSVNQNALWSYFNLRFTQGESTMFKNIDEIPPGTYKIYNNKGQLSSEKKYWDTRKIRPVDQIFDGHEFLDLFDTIIKEHNIADTSVGAFLSGGIDSTSIVTQSHEQGFFLDTYTFSTKLKDDEIKKAKEIAHSLGLKNIKIELSDKSLGPYKKALRALEDPLGDSIILPTMLLTEGVSKYHKVVLSGEGADEIFSGYIHHQFLNFEDMIDRYIPRFSWSFLSQFLNLVPLSLLENFFSYPSKLGILGKKKLQTHLSSMNSELDRYIGLVGLFEDNISKKIFSENLQRPKEFQEYWDSMNELEFPDKIKRFDLHYWARNYTLHRLDRLSMMFSLEARAPFFDHRLIEFILKMKSSRLAQYKDPKVYFRKCLSQSKVNFNQDVLNRKRQAFYFPTEKVFNSASLKLAKENILDNAKRRDIFNYTELEKLLTNENLELFNTKQFQCIFNYELWCQEFLD